MTEQASPPVPSALSKTVEGGSPHFDRVVSRLDVGGKSIQFNDHEGRGEQIVNFLKLLTTSIPEAHELAGTVDPTAFVEISGLADCVASGSSLAKDGDSWVSRSYSYLPDGPKGLRALLGTEAFEFRTPSIVPAATDLVVEVRLDATSLPDFLKRIGEATGRTEEIGQFLQQSLPTGDSVGDLLAKTRLHIVLGVDVSSWPTQPTSLHPVDFFVRISGGSEIFKMARPLLEQGIGMPVDIGDRKGWELPLPMVGSQAQPVLAFDEDGTVHLASRADYLKFVDTAEMKLGAWEEYQSATNHFPKEGNLLFYASPQAPVVLGWAVAQAVRASGEEGSELVAQTAGRLPARPLSFCLSHEKDGAATTAELPFAATASLGSTLPLLSGTSVLFVGARAWKKGSDRAACVMNTRNVQQAVRSHQNMNDLKEGETIPWERIAGPGGMMDALPTCTGGTYTFSDTLPPVGKLACTCSNPEHQIPAETHADW